MKGIYVEDVLNMHCTIRVEICSTVWRDKKKVSLYKVMRQAETETECCRASLSSRPCARQMSRELHCT